MICPKCQNLMKTVDRQGVHIDQCEGCRGIFLDRGELEQIVHAEERHYAAAPPPYQPGPGYGPQHMGRPDSPGPYHRGKPDSPRPYRGGYGGGYADSPRPYGGHGGHGGYGHGGGYYKKRKKRSFLEELFD